MIRTASAALFGAAALGLAAAPAALAQQAPADQGVRAAFVSDRLGVVVDGPEGAPDLILIPGLSSSPAVWQGAVDHLAGRYRIHRIHVAGFAGADAQANAQDEDAPRPVAAPVAEEIARYIRDQHLDRPAVVGHSMGGTMGMMLAARHPDLVGRLMVVDMIPFMGAMFGAPGATAESVAPVADQIWLAQSSSPRDAYLAQATASITGMIDTEGRREEALQDMRASDQRVAAAAFRELVATDLRPELGRITAPTEVLYVKFNDARMTEAVTDALYRESFATLPGARLTRIDDSAHFIMFDQPAAFYSALDAFLSAK